MADPYVHPEDPSAAAAIEAIREDFDFLDDDDASFTHIIDLGRKLPPFPEGWRDDAHKVPGCLAQVWLEASMQDGRLLLAGGSDALIVSGLVALVLRVYSGRTPAEVIGTDPAFLTGMPTISGLTTNRKNGIESMMRRIRAVAQSYAPAA